MSSTDPLSTSAGPPAQPSPLIREWQAFWLALGFLSRIPMLTRIDYSQQLMNQSSLYLPLAGLVLGAIYAGAYSLLGMAFSPLVSVILVVCFHLWITGAFHEDGLADSVDALGGGYTLEARLRIMKDSRIGTYGTVALGMALGLKVALLLDVKLTWLALWVAPCIARLTPLLLMRLLPYVTDPDQSRSKPVADGFTSRRLLWALTYVILIVVVFMQWQPALAGASVVAVGLVVLCWGLTLRKALGGFTGDTLGASVVFTELLLLLFLTL